MIKVIISHLVIPLGHEHGFFVIVRPFDPQLGDLADLVEALQALQQMTLEEVVVAESKGAFDGVAALVRPLRNDIVAAPLKLLGGWRRVTGHHFAPEEGIESLTGARRLGFLDTFLRALVGICLLIEISWSCYELADPECSHINVS